MIALNCTSCKKLLEIDDAFAGGVCRCQHCGTIQTVPASLKRATRSGAPQPAVSKALYQKKPRTPGEVGRSGSGLEALADSVGASSGLTRSALKTPRAAVPTEKPVRKPVAPKLLALAGAIIVLLLVVIVWLTTR
jgi:hypothetical protein